MKIYITGAEGLIGRSVRSALERRGYATRGCDLRSPCAAEKYDLRDARRVSAAIADCDGILHLGAVSRVLWGELYPDLCRSINIDGTKTLASAVMAAPRKMWFIHASSREIYGTPPALPCRAGTPPCPENLYARTKLAGERIIDELRDRGVCTLVVRFSNVFGDVRDYHDRVVPAFAKAAAYGGTLHLRGGRGVFDFTPLCDATDAAVLAVDAVAGGLCRAPAIDIVTGRATSLMDLARMALNNGNGDIVMEERCPFYPARFQGDPTSAMAYLGWKPKASLEEEVGGMVREFKNRRDLRDESAENYSWISAAV